ncbi:MAG: glycosyl transferase, partial [Bacteroidota bacterium]|nr:glycosyl transferase [Bacteroidota bacterium]
YPGILCCPGFVFLVRIAEFFTFLPHIPALILSTSIAWVAIVWCINLFNFLDGIDGYISTEVIFIGGAVFLLSGDQTSLLLASATLGFLFWNWQKARIFMGDVGSTLLGFTIAVFAIYHQNHFLLSIPVWLILTSVFWFDATVTLLRRIRNKEQLSVAHRKHAYQRIVQAGFSHQKTVLWALGLNLIGLLFSWFAVQFEDLSWLFLLADILFLSGVMRYVDGKKAFGEVV